MLVLVKLINGIELIGKMIDEKEGAVSIEDPLEIKQRASPLITYGAISLHRYMPFSKSQTFTFAKQDILNCVEVCTEMGEYYTMVLPQIRDIFDQAVKAELSRATHKDEISKSESQQLKEPQALPEAAVFDFLKNVDISNTSIH